MAATTSIRVGRWSIFLTILFICYSGSPNLIISLLDFIAKPKYIIVVFEHFLARGGLVGRLPNINLSLHQHNSH